jgi:hypothetical protein
VFNTFLQTFYYDAQPPVGALAFPPAGGTISSTSYTLVIRTDGSVTGAEVNIQDGDVANDDAITGQNYGNGLTNGLPKYAAASRVTADAGVSAEYPGLPQEYRFTYLNVPSSGSATIRVRLRESTTGILPNRETTLTNTVSTLAPAQFVQIVNPPKDHAILVLNSNQSQAIQACFTPTLATNQTEYFSIYINGILQPRAAYLLRAPGTVAGCNGGTRILLYNWTSPAPGTNVIQVIYTNLITLSDTRVVAVARPGDSDFDGMSDASELVAGTDPYDASSVLRITELANGNQLVVWNSVPHVNYQVYATTNLGYPLSPISPVIPASGPSTFYFDNAPHPVSKFYRIMVVP